ncbi:MAG: isoaspartyl peptidase/L-asparaginase, partial [Francisellaceae bacterium]
MKKIIIHGGCGAREDRNAKFRDYHDHLMVIIDKVYDHLDRLDDAIETAVFAAMLLEDDPLFNAGTGAKLQQDGKIRLSASIMDSQHNKFAGVINVENIQNPSQMARLLLHQHNSVLCGEKASDYAHQVLKLPFYDPMTAHRLEEYKALKEGYTGTIGVVALDSHGHICAITSTGGAGFELPGRVGDSPTVAGNFASSLMGISCTGIGEHIVNKAVAAKIHTRVADGMPLDKAVAKSIDESNADADYVGLIALDYHGNIVTGSTKIAQTLYAYADQDRKVSFYRSENSPKFWHCCYGHGIKG